MSDYTHPNTLHRPCDILNPLYTGSVTDYSLSMTDYSLSMTDYSLPILTLYTGSESSSLRVLLMANRPVRAGDYHSNPLYLCKDQQLTETAGRRRLEINCFCPDQKRRLSTFSTINLSDIACLGSQFKRL